MKTYKKHTVLATILCTILFSYCFVHSYIECKKEVQQVLPLLLKETLKTYIHKEKDSTYFFVNKHEHIPNQIGKYKDKTVQFSDTTFTFRIKIVDLETEIHRNIETLLLATETLSANTINQIFDSICHTHNIYANSAIGVTANFYKKVNQLSRDTTNIVITHKTAIYKQGEFEDINYYAYMEFTPYTYWRLAPQIVRYTTFGIILILLVLFFINIQKRKEKQIAKNDASPADDNNKIVIDIQGLTKQQQIIMKMFLEAPDYRVHKDRLKEALWPNHENAITNMTTAIKRLKDTLINENYDYTITTCNRNDSFYILKKKQDP
ncbi:helix-turn-helix domain-containing protein [Bacteroides sp. 519]|uniref:helix-turn-helix domain-containing protein n=1 Tax=Bacteroides sp. 519 TaxID=2302937 RepID=UPI0013D87F00|nr:helix-turn-helix domain-containing protein [Bacteroides sp. 519]NDV58503.1 helix-turn-helix domain-containing protein [Bacteroides sp. 519]